MAAGVVRPIQEPALRSTIPVTHPNRGRKSGAANPVPTSAPPTAAPRTAINESRPTSTSTPSLPPPPSSSAATVNDAAGAGPPPSSSRPAASPAVRRLAVPESGAPTSTAGGGGGNAATQAPPSTSASSPKAPTGGKTTGGPHKVSREAAALQKDAKERDQRWQVADNQAVESNGEARRRMETIPQRRTLLVDSKINEVVKTEVERWVSESLFKFPIDGRKARQFETAAAENSKILLMCMGIYEDYVQGRVLDPELLAVAARHGAALTCQVFNDTIGALAPKLAASNGRRQH